MKLFQPQSVTFVPMIAQSLLGKMELLYKKNGDRKAVVSEIFGDELEVIYTGGAYLNPDIMKKYNEYGIDITQGYGMTECSPRICNGKRNSPFPDSVGEIVPGCDVRIKDGEIWAKSRSVMMGYYKDPEETAKSLTSDGWLMTGDLGHMNDSGYLYITGRKKNLIILSNGENVSPEELENQFVCSPCIKEIIVYANDERITAEIFPNPEYVSEDIQADIRSEVDRINDTFPPAKRIVDIVFRDTEFEKTTSKKIIRKHN
jgi:long-chain acyl-CoA synthetase